MLSGFVPRSLEERDRSLMVCCPSSIERPFSPLSDNQGNSDRQRENYDKPNKYTKEDNCLEVTLSNSFFL